MKSSKEIVKTLIELSATVEEADEVINEKFDFKTVKEKIDFLEDMFGVETFDGPDEMTYWAMLNAIIQQKFS